MVPKYVTRDQLNEALAPLYALLGTSSMHVYDIPGIHITRGRVSFASVPIDDEDAEYPEAIAAGSSHPQGVEAYGELSCICDVEVIDGAIVESDDA